MSVYQKVGFFWSHRWLQAKGVNDTVTCRQVAWYKTWFPGEISGGNQAVNSWFVGASIWKAPQNLVKFTNQLKNGAQHTPKTTCLNSSCTIKSCNLWTSSKLYRNSGHQLTPETMWLGGFFQPGFLRRYSSMFSMSGKTMTWAFCLAKLLQGVAFQLPVIVFPLVSQRRKPPFCPKIYQPWWLPQGIS